MTLIDEIMAAVPIVLAVLNVVVGVPLSWLVAARLWFLHRQAPDLNVLRVNKIAASALAILATVFAAIFVNNGMEPPILDTGATQVITRGTLLALTTIPALYWLRLYWRR